MVIWTICLPFQNLHDGFLKPKSLFIRLMPRIWARVPVKGIVPFSCSGCVQSGRTVSGGDAAGNRASPKETVSRIRPGPYCIRPDTAPGQFVCITRKPVFLFRATPCSRADSGVPMRRGETGNIWRRVLRGCAVCREKRWFFPATARLQRSVMNLSGFARAFRKC